MPLSPAISIQRPRAPLSLATIRPSFRVPGFTHAETVRGPRSARDGVGETTTWASAPLSASAPPHFPSVHDAPLTRVAGFRLREESDAIGPLPSSKVQRATSPGSESASAGLGDRTGSVGGSLR